MFTRRVGVGRGGRKGDNVCKIAPTARSPLGLVWERRRALPGPRGRCFQLLQAPPRPGVPAGSTPLLGWPPRNRERHGTPRKVDFPGRTTEARLSKKLTRMWEVGRAFREAQREHNLVPPPHVWSCISGPLSASASMEAGGARGTDETCVRDPDCLAPPDGPLSPPFPG